MDFSLTREQELIRKMIAAFTKNEVEPIAAEIDRTHEYPAANIEKDYQKIFWQGCIQLGLSPVSRAKLSK